MSELKAYTYDDMLDGAADVDVEYYPKSEADKVIADLIEKNKRLARKDIIMASNAIKDVYKELRHNKYKRCLAMASYWLAVSYQCVDDKHRRSAERHRGKWLALANKFTEAK